MNEFMASDMASKRDGKPLFSASHYDEYRKHNPWYKRILHRIKYIFVRPKFSSGALEKKKYPIDKSAFKRVSYPMGIEYEGTVLEQNWDFIKHLREKAESEREEYNLRMMGEWPEDLTYHPVPETTDLDIETLTAPNVPIK